MYRYVQDLFGCTVDLSEEGMAYVYGDSDAAVQGASQLVQDIVALPVKGAKFNCEVTAVKVSDMSSEDAISLYVWGVIGLSGSL